MPSSSQHREKAERNCSFLRLPDVMRHPEWAAIVAFYAAMHMVERLCACESLHNDKHQDRLFYLIRHKKHRTIHAAFSTLFDASLVARYGTSHQFEAAFPGNTVEKILVNQHLSLIESHVAAHFAGHDLP